MLVLRVAQVPVLRTGAAPFFAVHCVTFGSSLRTINASPEYQLEAQQRLKDSRRLAGRTGSFLDPLLATTVSLYRQ